MVDEVRLLGYLKPSSFRALKMERANMKLNLWMIANRLYQMEPKLYIPEDAPINLQSARLSVVPNCVFVYQKGKDVICDAGKEGGYIIFSGEDYRQIYNLVQDTFDFYQNWEQILQQARVKLDYKMIMEKSWMIFHNPTVKDVAIAAIMAGCKPNAMPVLVAVFKALNHKEYNLNQSVTTSHPGGNMVIVSGPIAQEIGISGKQGCQGPGWPANATIGRAVNLVMMNVFRSVPGVCDLDCIASQAEFTFCFAEEPDLAQWNMINEDHYDSETTTVYVLKAEPLHDIIDFLSLNGHDLLDTITACCTTLGSNNAYMPGPLVICLTPDHGIMLKKSGYTKEMIQEHIHQYVYHEVPMVRNRGLVPVRPKEWENRHPLPVTRTPKDVEVVVVGGRGGHSGVILPWALHSEGCVEPIALPDGKIAKSIKEFKK